MIFFFSFEKKQEEKKFLARKEQKLTVTPYFCQQIYIKKHYLKKIHFHSRSLLGTQVLCYYDKCT